MTTGWVAATTQGRSLLGGLVGDDGARRIARACGWPDALELDREEALRVHVAIELQEVSRPC